VACANAKFITLYSMLCQRLYEYNVSQSYNKPTILKYELALRCLRIVLNTGVMMSSCVYNEQAEV